MLYGGDEMILYDSSDEYDTLLKNGMFRNREQKGIPISGSNLDGASWNQDEIKLHNKNFAECLNGEMV